MTDCKECEELEALQAEQDRAAQIVRNERYVHGRKHELGQLEKKLAQLETHHDQLSDNSWKFLSEQLRNRQYLIKNHEEAQRLAKVEDELEHRAAMIRLELKNRPQSAQ